MNRRHTVVDSPIGKLTLVAEDEALIGIYMEEHRHHPGEETFGPRDGEGLDDVITQLTEYFDGKRTTFDVPLRMHGTEFQRKVWTELLNIPAGETRTYGELAVRLGRPSASRAVGLANGKNPISIIVPCHRVVGADGSLTGYGGGLPRKRFLLELERGGGLF